MSQSDAARFIDLVEADDAFAQELDALKEHPEQLLAVVPSRGFDVDPDEIRDAFLERIGDDLTAEQFAAVAGGFDHRGGGISPDTVDGVALAIGGSVLVVGAAIAAAI